MGSDTLSSVEHLQSNSRAELGVKTAKRIINDNVPHQHTEVQTITK